MKKFLTVLCALSLALTFAACTKKAEEEIGEEADAEVEATEDEAEATEDEAEATEDEAEATEEETEEIAVMTYAEYAAAELETEVVIDAYVQGKQSWWDNKATIYAQDEDGAYFLYELPCSEEDYEKLVPGTAILVKGVKTAWEGEVEIVDSTFEIIEGEGFVAEPMDATTLLGNDELIDHQNKVVAFYGLTVEAIEFKNGGGDDIYLTLGYEGNSYSFCVEYYLTGEDSETYIAATELAEGDVIDVEGYLYWYQGPNPHLTKITPVEG